MSKRKRESDASDVGEEDGSSRAAPNFRRQRQVMAAFAQSAQKLEQALKLARGFERQKLGRRKKTAGDAASRIDAEVAALKSLDMARCAQNVLAKSLLKIKAVATAPDLPIAISNPQAVSSETAALNVYARLRNSNPVKAVLPAAAAAVKVELGLGDGQNRGQKGKQKSGRPERESRSSGTDTESDAHESEESDGDDDLGEGSDVDVEDLERLLEQEGVSRKSAPVRRPKLKDESVDSDSELDDRSTKKSGKAIPRKLFLPTLTMAGYISGSGSDVDEIGEDEKPKKNRRGQRARQAIWEKKYGQKAKHVQERERDAKQGWDAKKGAVSTSKFAKDANKLPLGKQRPMFAATKDSPATKKPQRDDTGPLHPSWEAAKKAKEKKSVPVVFQGKKINFD